jgi:hypothetical protein
VVEGQQVSSLYPLNGVADSSCNLIMGNFTKTCRPFHIWLKLGKERISIQVKGPQNLSERRLGGPVARSGTGVKVLEV